MGLLDKTIKIKVMKHNIDYYEGIYGKLKLYSYIMVSSEYVLPECATIVNIECDYCGVKLTSMYSRYYKQTVIGNIKTVACKKCSHIKLKESCILLYGVNSTSQVKEFQEKQSATRSKMSKEEKEQIQEKRRNTCIERYGVDHVQKLEEFKKAREKTMIDKYGYAHPSQVKEFQEKRKNTFIERFGCDNPFKSEIVKQKIRNTCLEKYGTESAMQNQSVNSKGRATMYENGTVATSKAQKHVCELYDGILNYPVGKYNVDILLANNIIVEYDGGGHNLQVIHKKMTQEEFENKTKGRYYCLKRNGYKVITLINKSDKLPSDMTLLNIKNIAIDILKECDINWVEINLDTMILKTKKQTIQINLGEINELNQ